MKFGTDAKERLLPRMATGRSGRVQPLSRPELGSDVQAIKASGTKTADGDYELNGQKMWVTNGLMSGVVFVLVKTDRDASPPYKGHDVAVKRSGGGREPRPDGPAKIKKMGYKGVESTRLVFDGYRCRPT